MPIDIRTILVPIDFSPNAEAVLEWAAHLAEEHACPLVLLHAYHLPVDFQQLEGAYLPPDFWTQVKSDAAANLERHAELLRARGLRVETILREGYPASVIEEEAQTRNVDLIVIGTRGHTGLKHLLLGSVAERVVQKAPCAVLTVKSPDPT
ncbi:universal stress protein [Myxococcota bacterium]|nr:universal stress protein [Myxococcota bacterium]MCZ7617265.1 universal stress protein [Myxococcota bacterium]